ncbi:MAG: hypothetical protein IIT38_03190, partial [Bacteroidales bacterium]|nr:hypothetical protein [Bacteroidales bacterium]
NAGIVPGTNNKAKIPPANLIPFLFIKSTPQTLIIYTFFSILSNFYNFLNNRRLWQKKNS